MFRSSLFSLSCPESSNRKGVIVNPSPDQILLFNPRLWTFGQASRSGPGAGGWWARREISCWAGRFSGADRHEAAQKLWWPAFSSICCLGSLTRTAWCRGLRLWIGPLGHHFWLTQWVWQALFLSFFLAPFFLSPSFCMVLLLSQHAALPPVLHFQFVLLLFCFAFFAVLLSFVCCFLDNQRQSTISLICICCPWTQWTNTY